MCGHLIIFVNKRIFYFLTSFAIIIIFTSYGLLLQAGWQNDSVGDSENPNCDIIKLEVSEEVLQITLTQTPILNESESLMYFYNIWVDTSGEDLPPDTETWDPNHELYEYVAHFDWRYTNDQWFNSSYLMAFNYYIDEHGKKHEGTYYWNEAQSKWQIEQPEKGIAKVGNNTIQFDVCGAIYREQPLGTGVVIRAVANAGSGLTVLDIAPNSGWVDEFDNMCQPPPNDTSKTAVDLSWLMLSLLIISVVLKKVKIKQKS